MERAEDSARYTLLSVESAVGCGGLGGEALSHTLKEGLCESGSGAKPLGTKYANGVSKVTGVRQPCLGQQGEGPPKCVEHVREGPEKKEKKNTCDSGAQM
ncbi:hypothetical protein EYF80_031208 [Liparis tanakae]|uniref:Uncharacterized protein n=1 Tax=Liparis tanakae TaxID=230148 RepID=A0A4Z2GYA1_9TELE|nr:hypothetical protein EYF80_031208 [Liparis tanakae]